MKKYINALIIAATILSATSCVSEERWSNRPDDEGAEVILRLQTPGSFAGTRGLTEVGESAIDNIYVLNFDVEGAALMLKEIKKAPIVASDGGSFGVTMTPRSGENELSRLVVLANAEDILHTRGIINKNSPDTPSPKIGQSYTAVRNAIFYELGNQKLFASTSDRIPMWGEAKNSEKANNIKISRENKHLDVVLLRAVARIDVGVGNAKNNGSGNYPWTWDGRDGETYGTGDVIGFSLEEVYVFKANDKYALIPDPNKLEDGKAIAPTVPTGTGKLSYDQTQVPFKFVNRNFTPEGQGLFITQQIYFPESDIMMIDSETPDATGTPCDGNHTDRMAIVVGGTYDSNGNKNFDDESRQSFYRLDFAADGDLMNVLRNHYYQFNIDKVTGPGYDTPEEAYEANPINMSCNIIDWDASDIGSGFDGPYHFSVSPSSLTFENAGGQLPLTLDTNYTGGWTATVVYEGTPTDWLTVPSSGTNINITAEANANTVERTAYIHFTVDGRITLKVKVTQKPKEIINENHVLYFDYTDEDHILKIGRWREIHHNDDGLTFGYGDEEQDITFVDPDPDALAFFKFGSVVGFTNVGDHGDPFTTDAIKFDPTSKHDTYTGSGEVAYKQITGLYTAEDYGNDLLNVSDRDTYHTEANLLAGKGDPCRLAGINVTQAREDSDYLAKYDSGWRLPTDLENHMFIGQAADNTSDTVIPVNPNQTSYTISNGEGKFSNNPTAPGITLPYAFGNRGTSGNVGNKRNNARRTFYWSSEPAGPRRVEGIIYYYGYCMAVGDTSLAVSSNESGFANGMAVRCVKDKTTP